MKIAILFLMTMLLADRGPGQNAHAEELLAGAAKVDITDRDAGPVNDPLYAKALVFRNSKTSVVIVTIDAVAIGEIGPVGNEFLPKVRDQIARSLDIPQHHILVNASHCHGVVCKDVAERTIRAIQQATKAMTPVRIGVGKGREARIMENRRLRLKDGREVDVRHAYSLPPDHEVESVGPIDPEIGVLRIDRKTGGTLAVVYNFACHPIQGVPGGGNSADLVGFASKVIEENIGKDSVALFLQGCAGDINPTDYKILSRPRNAEPLGNQLGLSTLAACRNIQPKDDQRLKLVSRTVELPRVDNGPRIIRLEAKRERLVRSLRGTHLNLNSFLPLVVKYQLDDKYPSSSSFRYLQEEGRGIEHLKTMDINNRKHIRQYIANIHAMEEITRLNTNLDLLRKHQGRAIAAKKRTLDVEVSALRIGEFVLTTFPGELTVPIGLGIKKRSIHKNTFVAGYTNGYIYYAPTSDQLENPGSAQEDSDCMLAAPWQKIYEQAVTRLLEQL